jgi:hypothetical protein
VAGRRSGLGLGLGLERLGRLLPAVGRQDCGLRPGRGNDGQSGTQCPVSLRQREEVQEMLRFPRAKVR